MYDMKVEAKLSRGKHRLTGRGGRKRGGPGNDPSSESHAQRMSPNNIILTPLMYKHIKNSPCYWQTEVFCHQHTQKIELRLAMIESLWLTSTSMLTMARNK